MIPFSISCSELRGLSALERFEVEEACRRKRPREERGHHLECGGKFSREAEDSFFPWFTAPFRVTILGSHMVWKAPELAEKLRSSAFRGKCLSHIHNCGKI